MDCELTHSSIVTHLSKLKREHIFVCLYEKVTRIAVNGDFFDERFLGSF